MFLYCGVQVVRLQALTDADAIFALKNAFPSNDVRLTDFLSPSTSTTQGELKAISESKIMKALGGHPGLIGDLAARIHTVDPSTSAVRTLVNDEDHFLRVIADLRFASFAVMLLCLVGGFTCICVWLSALFILMPTCSSFTRAC